MYISGNIEQILADERGNINIGSLYGKMSWKEECFPPTSSLNSAQIFFTVSYCSSIFHYDLLASLRSPASTP
nr:hypothetical protein CFP56_70888 [Quercus suber]